jgi:hypothetical protein
MLLPIRLPCKNRTEWADDSVEGGTVDRFGFGITIAQLTGGRFVE